MHLACWQVGLALDTNLAIRTLEEALHQSVVIVERDRAPASQQALTRAITKLRHPIPCGPRASGHIAAAQAAIRRCAAMTTETAAHAFELQFIPLEHHTVQIWIADQ